MDTLPNQLSRKHVNPTIPDKWFCIIFDYIYFLIKNFMGFDNAKIFFILSRSSFLNTHLTKK